MAGSAAAEKIELLKYANFVQLVLNDQTERRANYLFGVAGVLLTILISNYSSLANAVSATGRYGVWVMMLTAFATILAFVRIFVASKAAPFTRKKFYETAAMPNLLFYRYFLKGGVMDYKKRLGRADVADEYVKELFDLGHLVKKKNGYLETMAGFFIAGVLLGAAMIAL